MISVSFNSFVKQSNFFFIRRGKRCFEQVDGVKVRFEDFEDFDLFAHKIKKGKMTFWVVSEAISGCRITNFHKDFKSAYRGARKKLNNYNKNKLEHLVRERVANTILSPRYRFVVNPNSICYVATRKNKNKKLTNTRKYRVHFQKE